MCSRAVRGSDAFPSIETPRVHHAARGAVWPLAARAQQTTPTPVGYSAFATDTCCGKAKGYPIATIKAAAGWLIDSYAEAGIAPAPEAALAKHIIEAAKQGERDHTRLRDGALLALAQSHLRNSPPPPPR